MQCALCAHLYPQGYTTSSLHSHPRMRTLPLAGARGIFGWALLWSTLLASFPVQGSATALYNIALCGNIIIGILRLVKGYFPSWYHFVTYPGHVWTSKVQDHPHFFLEMGSLGSHHSVLHLRCQSTLQLPCNQSLWSRGFHS